MSEPTKETSDEWHKDSKNWKWGIFYYNKKDKRLFPPKKIKALGWEPTITLEAGIASTIAWYKEASARGEVRK